MMTNGYGVGEILLDRIEEMRVYADVCSNQPTLVGKIEQFSQRYKGFKIFLEVFHKKNIHLFLFYLIIFF